jgi:hypothetical protein
MNKNISYLFLIIITLTKCGSNNQVIKTFDTDQQVVIRYNVKYDYIFRVNLPIGINFQNRFTDNKFFIKVKYKYEPYSEGIGEDLYQFDLTKWIKIKNNKKKNTDLFEKNNLSLYSWYRLDSTKATQQQFTPYIKKMLAENKDTLHIGTVKEFKKNHGELFKALTKGDSISIQFLDGKKLGERITVPVVW